MVVTFVVEQAEVEALEIDEEADAATVRASGVLSEDAANEALRPASRVSGHAYRVRPGSWQVA